GIADTGAAVEHALGRGQAAAGVAEGGGGSVAAGAGLAAGVGEVLVEEEEAAELVEALLAGDLVAAEGDVVLAAVARERGRRSGDGGRRGKNENDFHNRFHT